MSEVIYESSVLVSRERGVFRVVVVPDGGKFSVVQIDLDSDHNPTNETTVARFRKASNAVEAVTYLEANGDFPERLKISVRQTQRGDWLVVAALQNKCGIGIHRLGSPAPGYTTGQQYGRYASEVEAWREAARLAEEKDGVVVEWVYPRPNPQFVDLPRQYPNETHYASFEEAEADGWIYINPSKTIEHYNGGVMFAQDITPGRAQGYELALMIKHGGQLQPRQFATNQIIWAGGRFSYRFRTGDVVDAIRTARRFIDSLA